MTIYIDVSAAVHRRAGLGRYATNLSKALHKAIPRDLALFHNREENWKPLPWTAGKDVASRSIGLGYKPWRLLIWLAQLGRLGFDKLLPGALLYHATEHLLMPLVEIPTVLTVHDLIFRLFPEHHKKLNYWYLNLTMPLYCKRASHIIAVSQRTKDDLLRLYGVPSNKVTVVHEAADDLFGAVPAQAMHVVRSKYGLPAEYAIFVGTMEPRKNLIRLFDALELLHSQGRGLPLVLVGSSGWLYEPILRRMEAMPDGTVIRLGYVPEEDLPPLYAAAAFSVLPSLYEGFGLPVLESMACGTPVACSATSSLPEVGGQAAMYFNPENADQIADTLDRLQSDVELRHELREAGKEQARCFSWERAAQETLSVYRQVQAKH